MYIDLRVVISDPLWKGRNIRKASLSVTGTTHGHLRRMDTFQRFSAEPDTALDETEAMTGDDWRGELTSVYSC